MAAQSEHDPVESDESVFRRVPAISEYVEDDRFKKGAFGGKDPDGLSVYRSLFATAEEVANAGPNVAGYYVVEFQVLDLQNLKSPNGKPIPVSVVPKPNGEPNGTSRVADVRRGVAGPEQARMDEDLQAVIWQIRSAP